MRCISCHRLSIEIVCSSCDEKLFKANISKRRVANMEVISLFKYKNIEQFLLTKHTSIGYRVYRYFSKNFIAPLIHKYVDASATKVHIIPIDESVSSGYSHTALLAHGIDTPLGIVYHAKLLATNRVNYAGKSLQFRLDNPRDFIYTGRENIDAIILDDIITTGITLQEAEIELSRHGVNVLFALTLADARD